MTITVISKRVFKMEHREELEPLLRALRKHAKKQPGFISRKTLACINTPGEYLTISRWENVEAWETWMDKKKTRKLQGQIDSLIGEKTAFDIYHPETY